MSVYLEEMLSGWDQQERNKVNENWRRIMSTFTNLQRQINILAGGEEVNELLQRLNDAVDSATIAVQESIDANNTATQDAITANNQALQTALNTIGDALIDIGSAIQAAETATNDAVEAKDAALQAAEDAQTTISQMQVIISNFRPRGEWNATTDYFKNNLAGLNGKTYIALQNNINKPVTDTSFWMLFADSGAKGEKGEKGDPGTGIKVLGHFNDVSELPSNPILGDAYTIGTDKELYVYNGNNWQNMGSIKGVEGKSAYEVAVENGFVGTEIEWLETLIGPPGPDGPPGPPADLTEINQKVDGIQNEVTEHLGQLEQTTENHINDNNKHLQSGERTRITNGLQKTGDTMTGDLTLNKSIPKIVLQPTLTTPDATKYFELYYNAAGANNFGVSFDIDQKPAMQILSQKDVRFVGHDNSWFSVQDLKSSVSDGKTLVASAISDMGVYTSPVEIFPNMANNIRLIPKGKTVQESTMTVPAFSGGSYVQVDVAFTGGTARNVMAQCGGRLLVHGMYYGTSVVSNGLFVSNIEVIGSTVRFTFNLGGGLGSWVGGSIRYTITS